MLLMVTDQDMGQSPDTQQEPRGLRASRRRHRIAVINGPNLSNLGARNRRVYGSLASIGALDEFLQGLAELLELEVSTFTSNHEGDILEFIHRTAPDVDAYVVNPAGLTTVGEGLRHALEETERPTVEVHFSNIHAIGGAWNRGLPGGPLRSTLSHTMTGVVQGLRHYSYAGALVALAMALDDAAFLGSSAD